MEGEVKRARRRRLSIAASGLLMALCAPAAGRAQTPQQAATPQTELNLRKSAASRHFHGQEVSGEERRIGRGDSLWRILVEEKGLSGKKFHSYLVVIKGLNPELKNFDVLRVGDTIFIPLRPDELLEARAPVQAAARGRAQPARGAITEYRVKAGEHLYQILREQLKPSDERRVAQYYALVKDLNPERKNWDVLLEGEILRLPVPGEGGLAAAKATPSPSRAEFSRGAEFAERSPLPSTPAEPKTPPNAPDQHQVLRAPAKDNIPLLAAVVEALGSQIQQSGEEIVTLSDGSIRIDKSAFPVIYNSALGQRVIIDPGGNIPPSLGTRLRDSNLATQVLPVAAGVSIQEAVSELLTALGYQPLPSDRPVVFHEQGVAFEAKGHWVALAPEDSRRTQDILVINVLEQSSGIPEYMKSHLAKKGLLLRDVVLSPAVAPPGAAKTGGVADEERRQVKTWPVAKEELVDSVLLSFGIPFGVAETLSVELRDGLMVDIRADRLFEQNGKRTALFFRPADPEVRRALEDNKALRVVELDVRSLPSRDLIARVLQILGQQAPYREHRFAASDGGGRDRLTLAAWGFHLPQRSMFVTDRQIPAGLYRFFFEKGLQIVYFQ